MKYSFCLLLPAVAQQCLSTAYEIDPSVPDHRSKYEIRQTLEVCNRNLSVYVIFHSIEGHLLRL